jgi:uncharacterized membrane protein
MAGKIEVTVNPTTFTLTAGENAEVTVTLRNLGESIDQFTLSIDGLDPTWYTLPVSSVALFPNDQDNLKVQLHPPKTAEAEAGSYPFRLDVASQESPDEKSTVELTLEIRTLPGLEMELSPQRIVGQKGAYKIIVNNKGGSGATVRLKARDAQGRLRLNLHPETVVVPPSGRSEAALEVRLGWLSFIGGEKELDFEVLATLPEGQFAE